jgi:predicted O-methyltransferase YrrM
MLAMGSDGGRFVETIVRSIKPKRGLEIGTSSGFSALCAMKGAFAAYPNHAACPFQLITIDFDPAKAAWARDNFEKAGVGGKIKILVEDGIEAARKIEAPLDYVLLDANKTQTLPIMKLLLPKLSDGAVVLTDNMLTHSDELLEFSEFVRSHPNLASSMYPIGNGIEVTIKLTERIAGRIVPGDKPEKI